LKLAVLTDDIHNSYVVDCLENSPVQLVSNWSKTARSEKGRGSNDFELLKVGHLLDGSWAGPVDVRAFNGLFSID
jgi:hypothetical protein